MQIERKDSDDLVVNGLPDGSKVIVDSKNEKVYALNATAGAAWDACGPQATLATVTDNMRRVCGSAVTGEVAEEAILQLQKENLVKTAGLFKSATRRQVLAGLTAAALPLVVSMTMSEQRAFAQVANSGQQHGDDPPPPKGGDNDGGNNDGGNNWNNHRPEAHVSHKSNNRLW